MLNVLLKILSLVFLVLLVLPTAAFLTGRMELSAMKTMMGIATLGWFITAAAYMWKNNTGQNS